MALHLVSHLEAGGDLMIRHAFGRNKRQTWGYGRGRQLMREQTTPQREKSNPSTAFWNQTALNSLYASAQVVSTYCLLGWLTDWSIGYDPDGERDESEVTCFAVLRSCCQFQCSSGMYLLTYSEFIYSKSACQHSCMETPLFTLQPCVFINCEVHDITSSHIFTYCERQTRLLCHWCVIVTQSITTTTSPSLVFLAV